MRKVFPFVLSGLLAVSFSQLAAAQSTSTHGSANARVGADVKAETGAKSTDSQSTSAIGGSSTGSSTGAGGATADTSKADRTHAAKGKHKSSTKGGADSSAAAGGSAAKSDKKD